MRLIVFALLASLTITSVAEVRPLSSKEVFLMLRAGYSSATILHELAQHRIVDAPDPSLTKSLGEFGASPQLLDALKNGQFRVGAAQAETARRENTAASVRQEEEAERILRDVPKTLKEQGARAGADARSSLGASLVDSFTGKLVRCRDGIVEQADASALASKKLIAFYFSAHWCPPCRKFTPELVDYYNRVAPKHPEFELIFVSYDKSRFNWETYMRDAKMPWLAIDYDQLGGFQNLKQAGGDGIPSLLVIDGQSRMVASSYEAGEYVGPQNALVALDKIFTGSPGQ